MNPLCSGVLPALGSCPRISEPLFGTGAALHQLHCLTAGDVNRGKQDKPVGMRGGM